MDYPSFTPFMSGSFVASCKVIKTRKMRLGPSEWFRFKLTTGYKEFDKKWLLNNNDAGASKLLYLRKFSKGVLFSWHGEAVATDNPAVVTLSKNDLMLYYSQTITSKAVPHHRKAFVLGVPSGLHTENDINDSTYLVRPSGVVQVTETSHAAQPQ